MSVCLSIASSTLQKTTFYQSNHGLTTRWAKKYLCLSTRLCLCFLRRNFFNSGYAGPKPICSYITLHLKNGIKVTIWCKHEAMRSIERCHFHWTWMTFNPSFKVTVLFKGEYYSNWCIYIVQLQIIYLLNLLYNVPPSRGPSAIAEPLVYNAQCMCIVQLFQSVRTTLCLKNAPTLKRYSSKLQGSILMKFGTNIQKTL